MRDSAANKCVLVLDTAAFIAPMHLFIYDKQLYTTPSVINEVKDFESVQRLSLSDSINRVQVEEPKKIFVEKAINAAKRFNLLEKLSKTDIEVLALALQLASQGLKVIVLTDDYDLQIILSKLGIEFRPVKTMGIKKRGK